MQEITKEFLISNYRDKRLTSTQIARLANCSPSTILNRLKRFTIPKRDMKRLDLVKVLTKEFLERKYVVEQFSSEYISKLVKASKGTVLKYLKKFNIPLRAKSSGSNHYNWAGGNSSLKQLIYTLPEYRAWRKICFSRDKYNCQECQTRGKLEVHHQFTPFVILFQNFLYHHAEFNLITDKVKLLEVAKTWTPFWDTTNGQTLCVPCHEAKKKETTKLINFYRRLYRRNLVKLPKFHENIIAVDFDGTLCTNCYPDAGLPNQELIARLIQHRRDSGSVILLTCRSGVNLQVAVAWCRRHGLEFDAVNDDIPLIKNSKYGKIKSNKPYFDILLDDKAFNIQAANHTTINNLPKTHLQSR